MSGLITKFQKEMPSFFMSYLSKDVEQRLKSKIYALYAEHKNNLEIDILLTVLIQGCFHAFASHTNDTDM
ncbi:MAG: hypothetical protein J6L77_05640 [Coprococcus sp.]|nr:hypothetical protein [Coprococcus sp.]